jgi:hypothetical protein
MGLSSTGELVLYVRESDSSRVGYARGAAVAEAAVSVVQEGRCSEGIQVSARAAQHPCSRLPPDLCAIICQDQPLPYSKDAPMPRLRVRRSGRSILSLTRTLGLT